MSDRKEHHEARRGALLQDFPRLLRGEIPYLEYDWGWDQIIRGLLQGIDELLDDEQVASFRIVQIKEKFGTLRLYYRANGHGPVHVDLHDGQGVPVRLMVGDVDDSTFPSEGIDRLIARVEEMSAQTCEGCGRPESLRRQGGWYTTLCDACLAAGIRIRQQEGG